MKIENILGDGIGYIELLEYMGSDAGIVERARKCYQSQERATEESDARLLKKLVGGKPLHGTTLRSCVMTFDVLAPQFVIRQWTRHIIGHDSHGNDVWYTGPDSFDQGGAYDEQSFRYADKIQFYTPPNLGLQQGLAWNVMLSSQKTDYENLRDAGVHKQLARCALGPAVYSQMEWTVNLQGALDWYDKRRPGGGAQAETVSYAVAVMGVLEQIYPGAIKDWKERQE